MKIPEGPTKNSPAEQQPKLINASDLVILSAKAGPGSDIRVRVHFKDGSTQEGFLRSRDDRTSSGPVVVIPNKKNPYDEGVLPLGGGTIFLGPPRKISSLEKVRNVPEFVGWKTVAHKIPIDPHTEGILFEVIN